MPLMSQPTRIALDTLGCKLNQAETERLARELARAGARLVSPDEAADVYILNTCTVTGTADAKARHLLRLAARRNPSALLVATGCLAERAAEALAKLPGVRLMVGNAGKQGIVAQLQELGYLTQAGPQAASGQRTRAFLAAQDGCNRFCAYCIVPYVRGRERSRPVHEVVAEVKARVAEGCREVVLTGTEVGAYHSDGLEITGLLARILTETDIARLRLSSLQPQEVTTELLALWRDPRLCPHFHLSLQSGSDSVLRRMRRRYDTAAYAEAVARIRAAVPDVAITTDIIVGFPGETEAEFAESLAFCQCMEFARIHVFSYSPRPGTAAAVMPEQIPATVKKGRSQAMLALARASARAFQARFLGRTLGVLWEQVAGGVWSGYTGNYIRVYTKSARDLTNQITPTKLVKPYRDGLWGELPRKGAAI